VRGVWNPASGEAYTGAGTRVVVIDDGFDYNHADLAAPYDEFLDFDFDGVDLDPFGTAGDAHGTAVTGIIGADNNGTGAVGVAFDASLVGYRTHGFISDFWLQNVRDAIHHAAVSAQGDVANISQGIANDANSEFGFGYDAARFDEIETSIGTAVAQGRGGLGTTVVKSAGNSRADNYDVNADDWTNDTRPVVVAAVDQDGFVSSYSSYGAALLVSAFGTRARSSPPTAPARPATTGPTSRASTARPPPRPWCRASCRSSTTPIPASAGATCRHPRLLGAPRRQRHRRQHRRGGALRLAVERRRHLERRRAPLQQRLRLRPRGCPGGGAPCRTWLDTTGAQTNGNEFTNTMDMLGGAVTIPDGNAAGTTFTGSATFDDEVERVTVTLTMSTTWTADMEIYVTSPDGTVSELIDDTGASADYSGTWTFETQAFRGERGAGTWSVRVVDDAGGDVLSVSDVVVRTFGRASPDERYVFTNEFATFAGVAGHGTIVTDANGGIDALNAAAVSTASIIDLRAGVASTIAGQSLTIAAGTAIENAYGGDHHDVLNGNALDNRLLGGRGNDRLAGGVGEDALIGGAPTTC
jgi:subtilisin-like proprotein convertase family protein